MDRRNFIRNSALLSVAVKTGLSSHYLPEHSEQVFPPVRRITNEKGFHWFGYYDKWQIDPTNRYVLGMRVNFEHRTPRPEDVIEIGMIDLKDSDKWIKLGDSRAWGWQQGCMLQWIPGSAEEVIWNDRVGQRFVSYIVNVKTGGKRVLSQPVYALSPDATWGVGLDFGRLQDLRPGYGYKGVPDPYKHIKAPEQTGIYRIDLKTGKEKLIIPYQTCARIPHLGENVSDYWHWYNHLLISPDSQRFIFLNRWRKEQIIDPGKGFVTRMFTANKEGEDRFVVDPSGFTSHFVWRDPGHICAWTRPEGKPDGFYLFKDKTNQVAEVGKDVMTVNGHNTYLAQHNNAWILNDTYPQGADRIQTPYLYHVPTGKRIDLGQFYSPPEYKGEVRCDLHPRYSPDGKTVIIDSTHEGLGRQMYLIDISDVTRG
jgi:hypothetical protein